MKTQIQLGFRRQQVYNKAQDHPKIIEKLKEEVYKANMDLPKYGLLLLPGAM